MGFINAGLGLLSLYQGMMGRSAANDAARAQAGTEKRMTEEKLFQNEQEERQLAGTTRAAAAGSGVTANVGSPLTMLAEQAKTFARERSFISEVGASRADQTLQRGRNTGNAAMWGGITSAIGSFAAAGQSRAKTGSFFKFG